MECGNNILIANIQGSSGSNQHQSEEYIVPHGPDNNGGGEDDWDVMGFGLHEEDEEIIEEEPELKFCPPTAPAPTSMQTKIVDYCMVCAGIAVEYNSMGNVIKREIMDNDYDYTHQHLFSVLCKGFGVRKNSKIKKDWDFVTDPFPFCDNCTSKILEMANGYRIIDNVITKIKEKLFASEGKYVEEDLYEKHDGRYYDFRKLILGDAFRGDAVLKRELRISSTKSIRTNNIYEDVDDDRFTVEKESTSRRSQRKKTRASRNQKESRNLEGYKENESGSLSVAPVVGETNKGDGINSKGYNKSRKRVRRSHGRYAGQLESSERDFGNFDDEFSYHQDHDPLESSRSDEENGTTNAEENESINGRRRLSIRLQKRKQRAEEADLAFQVKTEIQDMKPPVEMSMISPPVNGLPTSSSKIKKRGPGRPPKIPKEENDEYIEIEEVESENDSTSCDKIRSVKASLVTDPVSGNIYYRTLLFVKLEDRGCFQCSTCSEMIPFTGKGLRRRFHTHFIKFHSDCFKCRYCVSNNRFLDERTLEQHMQFYHNHLKNLERYINPLYQPKPRQPFIRKKLSNETACPICGKPVPAVSSSDEYRQHWYTHLNAVERKRALEKENALRRFDQGPQDRQSGFISQRKQTIQKPERKKRPYHRKASVVVKKVLKLQKKSERKHAVTSYWNVCQVCNVSVDNGKIGMRKHMQTHQPPSERVPNLCIICGSTFTYSASLENHLRRKHGQNIENNCKFPGCKLEFICENDLRTHVQTNHGNHTGHMCQICGRLFTTKQCLKRHRHIFGPSGDDNHYLS